MITENQSFFERASAIAFLLSGNEAEEDAILLEQDNQRSLLHQKTGVGTGKTSIPEYAKLLVLKLYRILEPIPGRLESSKIKNKPSIRRFTP